LNSHRHWRPRTGCLGREVQIGLARHENALALIARAPLKSPRYNSLSLNRRYARSNSSSADFGILRRKRTPFPPKGGEGDKEILKRGVTHHSDRVSRDRTPARIPSPRKTRAAPEDTSRLLDVPPSFHAGIRGERALTPSRKTKVVTRAFAERRTAGSNHHVGIERATVECLQSAHRPAGNRRTCLDDEFSLTRRCRTRTLSQASLAEKAGRCRAPAVAWDDERPVAKHVRVMMKYLFGSSARSVADQQSCRSVGEYQVG